MKTQKKIYITISFILIAMTSFPVMAANNALIKNKVFDDRRKEIDTAVVVKKVNGLAMDENQDQVEVSSGELTLEIECIVRTFAGMGTVDIGKLKQITVPIEAGHTYRLGAKLAPDGECTATIDLIR